MRRHSLQLNVLVVAMIFAMAISCTSIRAQTTKMPKDDLDTLMNSVLPFAQKMLGEHGEFFPYGGVITTKGEIIDIGASDGDEHPPSQKLIDMMTESFRAKAWAGEYRATAIVFDVRVTIPATGQKSDAIEMRLDHVSGMSVEVLLPYKIDSKGAVIYG